MNALPLLVQAAAPPAADSNYLVYALLLLAAAFVLLVLELFLPSGGLLGVSGAVAAIAAVGCFFAEDTTLGFASLLGLAVVTPVLLGLGLWIWPHTPIGRRLVLGGPGDDDAGGAHAAAGARAADNRPAVGATGKTLTPLRRVGTVRIDGRRVECLAERGMIDAGVSVRVSRVSGNEVFVRVVD